MTDLSPAQRLRRRYQPNPARELLEDFRAELAAADPAERQELFDAAAEAAVHVAHGDQEHKALLEQMHVAAFPDQHVDLIAEAHRDQVVARGGEVAENLSAVFAALETAASDAERSEIVAAAVASGAFTGDDDATMALLGSDPLLDAHLDAEAAMDPDDRARDEVDAADDGEEVGPVRAAFEAWHAGETETMEVTNSVV